MESTTIQTVKEIMILTNLDPFSKVIQQVHFMDPIMDWDKWIPYPMDLDRTYITMIQLWEEETHLSQGLFKE